MQIVNPTRQLLIQLLTKAGLKILPNQNRREAFLTRYYDKEFEQLFKRKNYNKLNCKTSGFMANQYQEHTNSRLQPSLKDHYSKGYQIIRTDDWDQCRAKRDWNDFIKY